MVVVQRQGLVQKQNSSKPKQHRGADDRILLQKWFKNYNTLYEFYKVHGHSNVTSGYKESMKLARWVRAQRKKKQRNQMNDEKVELLNELDFDWNCDDRRLKLQHWFENYNTLNEFYKVHGHSKVPSKYKENMKLARWVRIQRQKRQHNKLNNEKVELLNQLNFDWNYDDFFLHQWLENYNKLYGFYKEHGHSEVPAKYKEDVKLGIWVRTQRQKRQRNELNNEKVELLNQLNFVWDPHQLSWDRKIIELKAFINKHGHTVVPISDKNSKLALWVQTQRCQYRKYCTGLDSTLTAYRIVELEELGFAWSIYNNHNNIEKSYKNNSNENDVDNDNVDHNNICLLPPAGSSILFSFKELEDEFPTLNNGRYKVEYC